MRNSKEAIQQFISDPANDVILDAETYFHGGRSPGRREGAVFELASGAYRRFFLSTWGLLEARAIFDDLLEELARIASGIRDQRGFDTIVTCTPKPHIARSDTLRSRPYP
jgi:hypothetical protein